MPYEATNFFILCKKYNFSTTSLSFFQKKSEHTLRAQHTNTQKHTHTHTLTNSHTQTHILNHSNRFQNKKHPILALFMIIDTW